MLVPTVEWLPLLKAFSLCLSRIPCSGLRGPKHSEDKEGNEVKPIQCKASSLIEYSSVEYGTRDFKGPTRKALPAYHFEFQGASLGGSLMDMGGQSTLPGLITDTPRNQCGLVEARESERRKPAYSFFSSSSYPIMPIHCSLNIESALDAISVDSPIDEPPPTSETDKIPRASSIHEIGALFLNSGSSNSQVTSTAYSSNSSYSERDRPRFDSIGKHGIGQKEFLQLYD
ncbi:UNVERIFIED_CONTAM: hypothetical protein Scaly_3142300 [Sesamum calycinum]|uniref:Uncharacterized protein n=1 Tax=Sesamum calycinum TaxID=2727403 RepID=A0AAW2JGQ2_9LAMI